MKRFKKVMAGDSSEFHHVVSFYSISFLLFLVEMNRLNNSIISFSFMLFFSDNLVLGDGLHISNVMFAYLRIFLLVSFVLPVV